MKIKYFINLKLKSTNFIQIWTFSKEKLLESFSYINKSFSMIFFSQSSDKKIAIEVHDPFVSATYFCSEFYLIAKV